MIADDFRTRLLQAYWRSPYAKYGNGGLVAVSRDAGLGQHTAGRIATGRQEPLPETRQKLAAVLSMEAGDEA